MQNLKYLTESGLSSYLDELFPDTEFIRDRIVPNSGIRNRADFRSDKLKLIVEFDGYRHYSEPKVILLDEKKDAVYTKIGFKVVRIPYFVQLSKEIIKHLFSMNVNWGKTYPHGFVDEKAMMPASYCELGIKRFLSDLDEYKCIKKEIIMSLKEKIQTHKDARLVLPESLLFLV